MTENQDNSLALHHDVVEDQSQSLPRARRDVEWTEQVYYGKGCYVLKDPTTLRYYRLRPPEYTIYTMLDGKNTMEDVLAALRDRFPSEQYDAHAVMSFLIMLRGAALLHIPGERDTDYLLKRKETLTRGLLKRLTQEYLFFRIPVFDPDKLLNAMMRTIGGVIFSRVTGFLVLCMLGGAVLLVLNNIDKLGEARPILSWENMLLMVPTLLVIKLIHEFGHGLSAKYFGSEVHEMGVLFLVFAPFFYCDVSDAWMIPAKRKRMWITAAGVVVEMVLAGFSAYIWAFTESGTVINQFALNAMIAASVNTLFFNGNPLLRYDGYYFMMDLVEIPNLKQKGASYLWYLMQKYVLGVENPPETLDVKGREMLVIIYSVASFCYRCLIMVAIITLVWTFLDPYGWGIVGAVLAAVAIYSSLLQPLFNFVKFTFTQRHRIHIRLASTIVLVLVLGAIAYGVLGFPVEQSVEAQCVLRPAKLHLLYVTQPGFLEINPEGQVLEDGQLVKEGQVLLRLHDPDLEVQARNLELERQKLVEQREQARNRQNSADDKRIGFQLEGVQAQLEQAQEQLNRLSCAARSMGACSGGPRKSYPIWTAGSCRCGRRCWESIRKGSSRPSPPSAIATTGRSIHNRRWRSSSGRWTARSSPVTSLKNRRRKSNA